MKKSSKLQESHVLILFHATAILFFLFQICFTQKAKASPAPRRIQSVLFDKGAPHKVFLNPGLASVVNFPCFVADSFLGSDAEVLVKFSPTTKKSLYLSLRSTASRPTNLLVRCEDQATYFVLDLIPSQAVHQDVLEIRATFGRPTFAEGELSEIKTEKATEAAKKSEKPKPRIIVMKKPVLIRSSKGN